MVVFGDGGGGGSGMVVVFSDGGGLVGMVEQSPSWTIFKLLPFCAALQIAILS